MKQSLVILVALFVCTNSFSQDFKNYEIKRLKSFGINPDTTEFNFAANYLDFKTILKKERKRRTNKTVGIIFASVGAITVISGLNNRSTSTDEQGGGIGQFIQDLFIGVGVIELGVSVPLFISSHKRKKERDKLIQLYRE